MEKEINVRDYSLLIIKYWRILVGAFLIGLVAALMYLFVAPSVYESHTKLIVLSRSSKIELGYSRTSSLDAAVDVVTSPGDNAWLSIESLLGLTTAGDLIIEIRDSLDLRNESGELLSVEEISRMLRPTIDSTVSSAPMIDMNVNGPDPILVTNIADKWAEVFKDKNSRFFGDEIAKSYDVIDALYQENKTELDRLNDERREYASDYPVEILIVEIEQKELNLKYQLQEVELAENSYLMGQEALLTVSRLLEDEPEFLVLSKVVSDEVLWERLALDPDASTWEEMRELGLMTEIVNPVHTSLRSQKASLEVDIETNSNKYRLLSDKIIESRDKIVDLRSDLSLHQLTVDRYDREIEVRQESSDTFWGHRLEAKLALEREPNSVRIVEKAVVPDSRISPKPVQSLFVGGVLGLILGLVSAITVGLYRSQGKKGN